MTAPGYIVTGTDTGVGKTVFAAGLCEAIDASYWKPIQAGTGDPTDCATVLAVSHMANDRILPEVYRLTQPASPHIAAAADGININVEDLKQLPTARPIVVEGAGGVLVPLTSDILQIDLIRVWNLPVIVCARTTLGTINHTLLTIDALKSRRIPVHGIAFIGDTNPEVEASIIQFSGVTKLGQLPFIASLTPARLQAAFAEAFDVESLRNARTPQ